MEEQDEFIWKEKLYFSGKTGDTQTGKTDEIQRTVNSGWNVVKCNSCKNIIYKKEVTKYKLCPNCEAHFRMSPKERIAITCDEGTFEEFDARCILKIRWDIRIMIR